MWFLDAYVEGSAVPRRHPIDPDGTPLQIGRSRRATLTLPFDYVSAAHAELAFRDGRVWIRDLGSSNGTFVNSARIDTDTALSIGDIVQIGANQMVVAAEGDGDESTSTTFAMDTGSVASLSSLASQGAALRDLLANRHVKTVFEPIVKLGDRPRAIGFEILGRGTHAQAPESPGPLFQLAEAVDVAADLSLLFRQTGFQSASGLPGKPLLFVNTHPAEMEGDALLDELALLRSGGFDLPLTLEIHETSVLDRAQMQSLANALSELNIGFAYDDFGAGQARLLELVEIPPDYLKFDLSLIRGIDQAPITRVRLLQSLVDMVLDLDIACLAEGIETRDELSACRDIGFTHGQGFLFGRGQSAEYWHRKAAAKASTRNADVTPPRKAPGG